MLGCVIYHERGAEEPSVRRIGGARFRAVYVARGEGAGARLCAHAAARTLARAGVRRALFPEDYAIASVFERSGVGAISPAPLRRALAARIIGRYLERCALDPRRCTVLLAADDPFPELGGALAALSEKVRGLVLAVPYGGETLARALRRERGIAVRLAAPGETAPCDLNVVFSDTRTAGRTLALFDPALVVEYDAPLPERELAALWELGALDAGALRVRAVKEAGTAK